MRTANCCQKISKILQISRHLKSPKTNSSLCKKIMKSAADTATITATATATITADTAANTASV